MAHGELLHWHIDAIFLLKHGTIWQNGVWSHNDVYSSEFKNYQYDSIVVTLTLLKLIVTKTKFKWTDNDMGTLLSQSDKDAYGWLGEKIVQFLLAS